ncbi:MAG: glycosyltransferase family 4 protein [Clostridia bacterium]|nr:glycosyltransferase family 4 protein [Clostridia bacterium]
MRILLHTEEYLPTALACAIRMDVFASRLRALGHEVTVLAGSNNLDHSKKNDRPAGVIYAPTIKMRKKTTVMRLLSNLSFAVSSVCCAVGAGKFDVVITTSPPPLISISGWLIAKLKGAKLVYDVRDIWPDVALEMGSFSEGGLACRVFRSISDFMYRKADLITTVTPGKVQSIRAKLAENVRDKVRLISNGYDLRNDAEATDETAVEKYGLRDRFTCVYIGNVGLAQGLESLLEIAAKTKHRDVQFLIFGNGAEKDALESQAKERGLNQVRFCGNLPHAQVAPVLTHAQISYIPLKSEKMKDSVPTKLYESLALGCPVLLAAVGDAADLLAASGLGRSVSPDHMEEIVAAFDEMVEHYDTIGQNRRTAMQMIREKHSRQSAVLELEAELQKLCGEKTKGEALQ